MAIDQEKEILRLREALKKEQRLRKKAEFKQKKAESKQKKAEVKRKAAEAKNRLLSLKVSTRERKINRLSDELKETQDNSPTHCDIKNHKYSKLIVSICVELYVQLGCGFRGIVKAISILNEKLGWKLSSIPNRNSIENWVKKCGYAIYREPALKKNTSSYAAIIDESMMVGGEKLLLTLGVNAAKSDSSALTCNDVDVLDMSVSHSWNSQAIKTAFQQTTERYGSNPEYVISDNGTGICKAIKDLGYTQIRDVGHTIGLCMERVYKKDEEYMAFMNEITDVKHREVMNKTAYLLAPKQRAIARFMNQSHIVNWAYRMSCIYHTRLSAHERKVFSFIPRYASLIEELNEITTLTNKLLKIIKTDGFPEHSHRQLQPILSQLMNGNERARLYATNVQQYIKSESRKVASQQHWHASSDIIESIFGVYKARKSPNALHGVTPFSLIIPLRTKIGDDGKASNIDFKTSLEQIRMHDLYKWKQRTMMENLVTKRVNLMVCA